MQLYRVFPKARKVPVIFNYFVINNILPLAGGVLRSRVGVVNIPLLGEFQCIIINLYCYAVS
jgi:hypothetical protein